MTRTVSLSGIWTELVFVEAWISQNKNGLEVILIIFWQEISYFVRV